MAPFKPKNLLENLNCAIEGVIYAVKTQRHMRYHFLLALGALILGILLNLPILLFLIFILSLLFLLFAEMVNTAIEVGIDIGAKNFHPLAKVAKDISAGAVLISSFGIFVTVYVIFERYLSGDITLLVGRVRELSGYISLVSLLIVLIGVVMAKAHFGKGKPLHGGMPSGHSAVAFSLWTSLIFLTTNPLILLLAFGLAAMVSHSRLVTGIHTLREVIFGAVLGIGLTLLVFTIFSFF